MIPTTPILTTRETLTALAALALLFAALFAGLYALHAHHATTEPCPVVYELREHNGSWVVWPVTKCDMEEDR